MNTPGADAESVRLRFRQWLGSLELRAQISLFLALGTLLIVASMALPAFFLARSELLSNAHSQLQAKGRQLSLGLELRLTADLTTASSLATSTVTATALVDSMGRETYLVPLLRSQKLLVPGGRLVLTDYRGKPIASSGGTSNIEYGDPAVHKIVLDQGKAYAVIESGPSRNSATLLAYFPVIYPLTGYPEGMLVYRLPLDPLLGTPSAGNYQYLIGDNGKTAVQIGGLPTRPVIESREELSLPAPVNNLRLRYIHAQDRSIALSNLRTLFILFVSVGLLLIVVVLYFARRAAEWLTSPLRDLALASEDIASTGILRPLKSTRADEFGRLVFAFNQMVERVRASQSELENRVEERTHALAESEARLRYVMDATGEGLWDWNVHTGTVIHNTQWTKLLGLDDSAATGTLDLFIDHIHPEDRKAVLNAIQACLDDNTPYIHEHRMVRADGSIMWVLDRGKVVERDPDSKPTRMAGSFMDITARKQMEQALEQSEQRWQLAVSGSNDGIYDWDMASDQIYLSDRFKSMLGYAHDELEVSQEALVAMQHPEDRKRVTQLLAQHLAGKTDYFEAEFRMRCKDGAYKWVLSRGRAMFDADGRPVRMTGSQTDISDRQAAELAIRERTKQLSTIFQLSPSGLLTFGTDYRVRFANLSFSRITGLPIEQLIGCKIDEVSRALATLITPSSSSPDLQLLLDETRRHGESTSAPLLLDVKEEPVRILQLMLGLSDTEEVPLILFVRDITRETEVDRMKSEFLSTAAHELRTPMASIKGFSELLLHKDFDEATRQDILETICNQSDLMASILNELLDLARIESRQGKDFHYERMQLAPLVEKVMLNFPVPANRAPPLLEKPLDAVLVMVDRNKMGQVLSNVLSNAYKYSPGGGDVQVKLLPPEEYEGRKMAGFRVSDHGIGMTPDQLARVTERFYRADTSGAISGTGLGMSIVKEIVDFHKGRLRIESTPGKGTRVDILLPVLPPDEGGLAEPPPSAGN